MKKRTAILSLVTEGILIVLSISLAFYVENKRVEWNAKSDLVNNLRELKEAIAVDTLVFYNVATIGIPAIDSVYEQAITSISSKKVDSDDIYWSLKGEIPGPTYHNWILERLLKGDDLKDIDQEMKSWLWDYLTRLEFYQTGDRLTFINNVKVLEELLITGGDPGGPVNNKQAGEIRKYLVHNRRLLPSIKADLLNHSSIAISVMTELEKRIQDLQ